MTLIDVKDRVYLKHNMKQNDREQELTAKKGEEDRERSAAAQGKKGGEIVLNTEQCRELNQISAGERR